MERERSIIGYIWFNPDEGVYQKGNREEYDLIIEASILKSGFSLILELTNQSDLLAHRLVKELNQADAGYVRSQMKIA